MRSDRRSDDSIDGKLERAKDVALGSHHRNPSVADQIGETAGGISGVLLGAGIGSAAGPAVGGQDAPSSRRRALCRTRTRPTSASTTTTFRTAPPTGPTTTFAPPT